MRYVIGLLGALLLTSPSQAAQPYATHNATRTVSDTIDEIRDNGNWPSFSSALEINLGIGSDVILEALTGTTTHPCPEGGRVLVAGVEGGTRGTYSWRDCYPGEALALVGEKPAFSLYCGNPIAAVENIRFIVKQEPVYREVCRTEEHGRGVVYHNYHDETYVWPFFADNSSIPITSSSGAIHCTTTKVH